MGIIDEYWAGTLQRLQAEVANFNRLIAHQGERGRENEQALSRVLGAAVEPPARHPAPHARPTRRSRLTERRGVVEAARPFFEDRHDARSAAHAVRLVGGDRQSLRAASVQAANSAGRAESDSSGRGSRMGTWASAGQMKMTDAERARTMQR